MRLVALAGAVLAALLGLIMPVGAETPVLRIAVLKFGTVNWEIDTIDHFGFDQINGFEMDVKGVAGSAASQVAFQGGEADIIVSDWIWVARQRAAGKDYVFVPYSRAVGGVMVGADSKAQTVADLSGAKLGIAGGPLDKSWIILQAYAQKEHGLDLAAKTEQVFGAPPLIYKSALNGEIDAAINFWHFMARMKAAGMRELISVSDAAVALGLDPETPMLGYVFKGEMLRENPGLLKSFVAASRSAKALLAKDDSAWERLKPRMPSKNDAEFLALKAGYRDGIPATSIVDQENARKVFSLMVQHGGSELIGTATDLPEGVFLDGGS